MNRHETTVTNGKSAGVSLTVRLGISLLLLLIAAVGCYPLYLGVQAVREALDSRAWPTTPGKITRSQMDVRTTKSKDDKGRVRESHSYHADIQYQYEVGGVARTGSKVTVMTGMINTEAAARATLDKYPIQADVTVAYDPLNTSEAVLEPGEWWGATAPLFLAAMMIGIPLLILRAIWKSGTPDKKASTQERELGGLVFRERILDWKPGHIIHVHRDHETLTAIVIGSLFVGGFLGLFIGLIPAVMFFSGRGNVFMFQFYVIVSGLIALAFGVPFGRAHRRRDFVLDWGRKTLRAQVGWSVRELTFHDIKSLALRVSFPKHDSTTGSNLQGRIELELQEATHILLEAEVKGHDRNGLRAKLKSLLEPLATELKVPWAEKELDAQPLGASSKKPHDESYHGEYLELVQAIEQVGGKVECRDGEVRAVDLSAIPGTDGIVEIVSQIPTIQQLTVTGKEVTDVAAEHLAKLSELSYLVLDDTSLTDAGVAHLTALEELECLSLNGTLITNDALRRIDKMTWLFELEIARTQIDDVGLSHLHESEDLCGLNVRQTRVTSDGVKNLCERIPNCEVEQDGAE